MSFEVRHAKVEDAETIAGFLIAMAMETEGKQLAPSLVEKAVGAVFDDKTKGFYVVGESDGTVVASLLVTFEWSDWRNCNMWYIQSVFVIEQERGRGMFKSMYQFVLDLAKSREVMFIRLYVELENETAQKVYESLGMKRMPYYMYDVKV